MYKYARFYIIYLWNGFWLKNYAWHTQNRICSEFYLDGFISHPFTHIYQSLTVCEKWVQKQPFLYVSFVDRVKQNLCFQGKCSAQLIANFFSLLFNTLRCFCSLTWSGGYQRYKNERIRHDTSDNLPLIIIVRTNRSCELFFPLIVCCTLVRFTCAYGHIACRV